MMGPFTGEGLHVAIIMDGNGRWALRRSLPRAVGHRAGVATVRRIVEHALHVGIAQISAKPETAGPAHSPVPGACTPYGRERPPRKGWRSSPRHQDAQGTFPAWGRQGAGFN